MLLKGNCLELLTNLPDNFVDSIVSDPPYELSFMGKGWDGSGIAYSVELWQECLRVLKPGGHLLAFGGTRTYHRMAVAIEDAGFEIRDSIHWTYGSGFPKSLDVSKAMDKSAGAPVKVGKAFKIAGEYGGRELRDPEAQGESRDEMRHTAVTDEAQQWQGWGTALKPSHEPIVVARKPLVGTVAANVLEWGTGALNIDGCRVPSTDQIAYVTGKGILGGTSEGWERAWKSDPDAVAARQERANAAVDKANLLGRWPANTIITHSPDCDEVCAEGCPVLELDRQSGVSVSKRADRGVGKKTTGIYGQYGENLEPVRGHNDTGGASRFFTQTTYTEADYPAFLYYAKASKRERNAGLEGQEAKREADRSKDDGIGGNNPRNRSNTPKQNFHPTVKPVELMRHLVRLVTPKGGTVLDPFLGSGTTAVAAILEGCKWIGCEMTEDYWPIIEARVEWAAKQQGAMF